MVMVAPQVMLALEILAPLATPVVVEEEVAEVPLQYGKVQAIQTLFVLL
jgi:hypothetical protein